jgi:DMSO/TMAO reductase YedYZ heme-binding membrane subunit
MALESAMPITPGIPATAARVARPKPFSLHDYLVAAAISLGLTLFGAIYLGVFRRTYLFNSPPSADPFFVPNKIIIGTGILMLAFTFLIGPISRYFDKWDRLVRYRKEIGIIGGFFALLHALGSYLWLPKKFPQSTMDFTGVIYGAGLVAAFITIFLILISSQKAVDLLGSKWWFLHRWGLRALMLFAVIHVYVMKWNGAWVKWVMKGGGPSTPELPNGWLPGLGLLTGVAVTWVVIVRLYETIFIFKDLGWKPKEIQRDPKLRRHGRRFFIISFCLMIATEIFMLTHWLSARPG